MEDLKIKYINAHQLYRLLLEPEFSDISKNSPVSVRRMVEGGDFGEPIIIGNGKKRTILVDLYSAYGHKLSRYISRKEFVDKINNWL